MKLSVSTDYKSAINGFRRYDRSHVDAVSKSFLRCTGELLRLSTFEVAHDKGILQASGKNEVSIKIGGKYPEGEVSYNTKYAWRMHEHPEYRFQKGRKAKYLEDPAKNNLDHWNKITTEEISRIR